ncbi:MAG TPA: cell division protein SepF, partial [Corynebacterium sp.]|nr:cell division protein SepF [Corynebacterium sp.]
MEPGDNKRIVDFAAGLCYALRGKMVNVTRNIDTDRTVFAITPEGAEFSQIELERAAKLR